MYLVKLVLEGAEILTWVHLSLQRLRFYLSILYLSWQMLRYLPG
jgi:hypothetical protein